jgi:hypothetical protein
MAQSGEACDVDGADGAPSRFFVCGLGPGNVTVTASGSPLAPDHYDVDVTFKEILPEEYR